MPSASSVLTASLVVVLGLLESPAQGGHEVAAVEIGRGREKYLVFGVGAFERHAGAAGRRSRDGVEVLPVEGKSSGRGRPALRNLEPVESPARDHIAHIGDLIPFFDQSRTRILMLRKETEAP